MQQLLVPKITTARCDASLATPPSDAIADLGRASLFVLIDQLPDHFLYLPDRSISAVVCYWLMMMEIKTDQAR
jgi:hypothetical protein